MDYGSLLSFLLFAESEPTDPVLGFPARAGQQGKTAGSDASFREILRRLALSDRTLEESPYRKVLTTKYLTLGVIDRQTATP